MSWFFGINCNSGNLITFYNSVPDFFFWCRLLASYNGEHSISLMIMMMHHNLPPYLLSSFVIRYYRHLNFRIIIRSFSLACSSVLKLSLTLMNNQTLSMKSIYQLLNILLEFVRISSTSMSSLIDSTSSEYKQSND